jgi:hypothetical protein
MRGWVRWAGGRPADSRMGHVADRFVVPLRDTLGFHDENQWEMDGSGNPKDPWQLTMTILLAELETGQVYTFSTATFGGRDALQKLAKS